jgi:hypothetical protein
MTYRRTLIRLVTFLGGIYFFILYVLPATVFGYRLDAYDAEINDGFTAIGAMAVGLGLINLLQVHGGKIAFRRTGWVYSCGLLMGLAAMIVIAAADWRAAAKITGDAESIERLRDFAVRIKSDAAANVSTVRPFDERARLLVAAFGDARSDLESLRPVTPGAGGTPESVALRERTDEEYRAALAAASAEVEQLGAAPSLERLEPVAEKLGQVAALRREVLRHRYELSSVRGAYTIFYEGLFVALGSAMFSLLGFYIAAAAYRAFRVRSAESGLMMGAALLVMLGQIPFGVWLWEGFPEIRLWLLSVPSTAAFRAIKIGAAVAGLVLAFRMWFSIESEKFSREER